MGIYALINVLEVFMDNNNQHENNQPSKNQDIENNKVIAALAYIIFFLPLIAAKDSEFGKFHANQGLLVLLMGIAVSVIGTVIPILGWFIILPLGSLIVMVFAILGIINALNGLEKELPLIGNIKLLK